MNRKTSFKLYIRPMFSNIDVEHMVNIGPFSVKLDSYDEVKAKADSILLRLKNQDRPMPPKDDGGPWPNEWIDLFERWIKEGHPE